MSNPMGERNLLVGILAWQKKFISGDTLTAAMTAWTLAKDKGLPQILREQNALTENQHALLEEATYNCLSRHGNDVTKTLAALGAVDPVKQELAKIGDADLQAGLAHVAIPKPVAEPAAEIELIDEVIEAEATPTKKVKPSKAAVPKSVAPQPEAAAASSIGMWGWLAGGLLIGSGAVFCLVFSFGLTVVLMRGQPPVAQVKADAESVIRPVKDAEKPDDKPPPPKEKVKPDQPPPVFDVPIVDRKPTEVVGDAIWRIDGNQLAVDNPTLKRVYLFFGSKAWTDYDFSYETNSAARHSGTLAAFRATDTQNYYGFSLGAFQRTKHTLSRIEKGLLTYDVPEFAAPFQFDQWYAVRIEARGNRFRCFVDGVRVFDYQNNAHATGQVALGATPEAKARWKNIRVTTPDGRVLWDGLPEIAATTSPPAAEGFVSLFNGKDLAGWQPHAQQPGDWRVVNGILSGFSTGNGHLFTTRGDYRDFHLRVEARAKPNKAGGVRFRYAQDLHGYETTLNHRTGGMIHVRQAGANVRNLGKLVLLPADQWATVDIIAQGNRLQLKVNGKTTVDAFDGGNAFASGHICLYDFKESIEFRKIEIKELKSAPAPAVEQDFVPLFNGKDLTGWRTQKTPPGIWRVENGILVGSSVGRGTYPLQTERAQPRDFHLRLEARISDRGWGSLRFCCPDGSILGFEAPINSNFALEAKTGTLRAQFLDKRVDLSLARDSLVPPDQWFTLDVIAEGAHLILKVDGKTTADIKDLIHPLTAGHLSLFQSGFSKLELRKIEIKKLHLEAPAAAARAGAFVPLFNGKDLAGWRPHARRPGNWRVENGILVGSAPNGGALYSTRSDYQDFHLRAEIRINDKGFGRIFGRAAYDPTKIPFKVLGYEVLLNQRPLGDETGTLTATSVIHTTMTKAKESAAPPGEWFLLEIVAQGDLVTVKVNAQSVAEFRDEKRQFARSGHVALHQDANATIEFRKIEIEDLAAR